MSSKLKIIFSTLFLLTLLFGLAQPIPVMAALSIATITPNVVVNDIPNTITITGSDFAPGAQVKVGGSDIITSEYVVTNYMSATELIANIPLGFTPGVYTVYVINPDTTSISIPAGLTVALPTPVPTPTQLPFTRPQVVVGGYSTDASGGIRYGQEFTLTVRLVNSGGMRADGIQVSFVSPELLMLRNGGVMAVGSLNKGSAMDIAQTMTAANPFYGVSTTALEMNVSYYDEKGVPFTEKFTLNLSVYNT
jgi:hypothetical protein